MSPASMNPGGRIMDACQFNRILSLERKRSYRTGNPFLLLLVDIAGLPKKSGSKIRHICEALQAETRDTDLCGWHSPSVFGIIFTAIQLADRASMESAITGKMKRALRRVLPPSELERVAISFHLFPEISEHDDSSEFKTDKKLYPDLINAGISKSLYNGLKRAIDVLASLILLILLSPLFAIISMMIKFNSDGPVFFRQKRVGRFGKLFECFKFRTMYTNCDHEIHRQYVQKLIQDSRDSKGIYKIVDDPRITAVGKFLRKTSLDELPQFLNVLFGDMSLVGPRPPIPYEIACYRPWHRRRIIETKPGITGLWQIYGRSRTTFDEMVRLDIRYIEEQSLWLDLKVLLLTPWAVITCLGAY